jgi:hypothetical protein
MGRRGQRRRRTETPLAETLSGALGFYESADDADGRRWREGQLEPVKKLQSAALLLDFWLGEGGGNTRSGLVPPEQRRSSQKDTQPCGREQERPSGRVARSVTARCGDAPSRAPCHPAFLALVRRFLIFSQVLRLMQ